MKQIKNLLLVGLVLAWGSLSFAGQLIMNMGNVPSSIISTTQATECNAIPIPSEQTLTQFQIFDLHAIAQGQACGYVGENNMGQVDINQNNQVGITSQQLAQGVYLYIQAPSAPVSGGQGNLNFYVFDSSGNSLTSGTYTFNWPYSGVAYPCLIAYQVSNTFVFSGVPNCLYFLQSPLCNLNSMVGFNSGVTPACSWVSGTQLPAASSTNKLTAALAAQGASQVLGIPLPKASLNSHLTLSIAQNASGSVSNYFLKGIEKIVTTANLQNGIYVVLNAVPNVTNSNNVTTYTVYDYTGNPLGTSSTYPVGTGIVSGGSDLVTYIRNTTTNSNPDQPMPGNTVGMYVASTGCFSNPFLVMAPGDSAVMVDPFPVAYFFQYAPTGTVNPTPPPSSGGTVKQKQEAAYIQSKLTKMWAKYTTLAANLSTWTAAGNEITKIQAEENNLLTLLAQAQANSPTPSAITKKQTAAYFTKKLSAKWLVYTQPGEIKKIQKLEKEITGVYASYQKYLPAAQPYLYASLPLAQGTSYNHLAFGAFTNVSNVAAGGVVIYTNTPEMNMVNQALAAGPCIATCTITNLPNGTYQVVFGIQNAQGQSIFSQAVSPATNAGKGTAQVPPNAIITQQNAAFTGPGAGFFMWNDINGQPYATTPLVPFVQQQS